jgi:LmbE family N-acetylglucosaminyl deacetylase
VTRRVPTTRVAVVAPHPDDEVLGCASVLVSCDTIVVHATDGVPRNVVGEAARELRSTREREARAACALLGARVERFVDLGERDQELWSRAEAAGRALADVLGRAVVGAVYVPAFQSGHPDHDGLYVAAQIARDALVDQSIEWWCYALYALDDRGRAGYGWLHPDLFPDVTERRFTSDELTRKADALRAYHSQVHDDSVVQAWIDAPVNERFAPLPPRDTPIPPLRSYYDEIFRFHEQGIDRDTVDRTLRAALGAAP